MRSFHYILPLAWALFCLISPAAAQETKVVRDLKLWTGVEVEKSFLKDWQVSLEQELRLDKNISGIDNFFTQAGLRYRINKNFSLGGMYRYIRNKKSNGMYENRSRYSLDLRYKGKIGFITATYRLRYQKEVESMRILDRTEPYEKCIRHKIGLRYNDLRRIEPYISAEIFQLHLLYRYPELKELRVLTGIQYSPGSFGVLKFAWGLERELNSNLPYSGGLIKINYTYEF